MKNISVLGLDKVDLLCDETVPIVVFRLRHKKCSPLLGLKILLFDLRSCGFAPSSALFGSDDRLHLRSRDAETIRKCLDEHLREGAG